MRAAGTRGPSLPSRRPELPEPGPQRRSRRQPAALAPRGAPAPALLFPRAIQTPAPAGLHGIIECLGWKGPWRSSPGRGQGLLPLDQVAQNSIRPGLEHLQGRGSSSFSGQPVPPSKHIRKRFATSVSSCATPSVLCTVLP